MAASFRVAEMEAALAKDFSAAAIEGIDIDADEFNEGLARERGISRPSGGRDGETGGRGRLARSSPYMRDHAIGVRQSALPESVEDTLSLLAAGDYVAERSLATAVFLSLKLGRPLFLEGEAGVGKTEIAKVLAGVLGRDLVRLQCYEGLDVSTAVYEWNYPRQMIAIRLAEGAGEGGKALEQDIYAPEIPDQASSTSGFGASRRRSAGTAHR